MLLKDAKRVADRLTDPICEHARSLLARTNSCDDKRDWPMDDATEM